MSDINEVRARLERSVAELHGSRIAIDVGALLEDHARLQAVHSDLASMRAHMAALPVLIEAVQHLPDAEQVLSQWDKARAFQHTGASGGVMADLESDAFAVSCEPHVSI